MCGRFTLRLTQKILAALFGLALPPNLEPRFNIAPGQMILTLRIGSTGEKEWAQVKWGLIPPWATGPGKRGFINARSESVAEKPSFQKAFQYRRCLIPADGFYEWERQGAGKKPWHFTLSPDQPFAFAGLWEKNREVTNGVPTGAVLTTSANALVQPIHDRMPVIIDREQFDLWLNSDSSAEQVRNLCVPYPERHMKKQRVSSTINSSRIDSPACLTPDNDLF